MEAGTESNQKSQLVSLGGKKTGKAPQNRHSHALSTSSDTGAERRARNLPHGSEDLCEFCVTRAKPALVAKFAGGRILRGTWHRFAHGTERSGEVSFNDVLPGLASAGSERFLWISVTSIRARYSQHSRCQADGRNRLRGAASVQRGSGNGRSFNSLFSGSVWGPSLALVSTSGRA